MANASERNRRALARLIRERQLKKERDDERRYRRTVKDKTSTPGQKKYARSKLNAITAIRADVISQAEQWPAYRLNYPNPLSRTVENATLFVSGFGSEGQTGQTNRRGGFVATQRQIEDRNAYVKKVTREARRLSSGVRDFGAGWWTVWREDYNQAFGR